MFHVGTLSFFRKANKNFDWNLKFLWENSKSIHYKLFQNCVFSIFVLLMRWCFCKFDQKIGLIYFFVNVRLNFPLYFKFCLRRRFSFGYIGTKCLFYNLKNKRIDHPRSTSQEQCIKFNFCCFSLRYCLSELNLLLRIDMVCIPDIKFTSH